jgi:hypothetical protein
VCDTSEDLGLLHVATPAWGYGALEYNTGAQPAPGMICTTVGFGFHTGTAGVIT